MRIRIKTSRFLLTLLTGLCIFPVISFAQLINNGARIVAETGSYIVLNDLSLENNGTFNQNGGTVLFTGNANATISGASQPSFYSLQLNKPGGTLQLLNSITIKNGLEFTNGLLDLNTNNIRLQPAALLVGESATSHVSGTTGGYVEITNVLNIPAGADPGKLGLLITSAQNLGSVTIRRGHQSQTSGFGTGNSILRYYDVMPVNNSGLNATLRINYFDAELNGLTESQLTLWKRVGTTWIDLGRTSNDVATNFVEESPVNDLTRFTLTTPDNALPLIWNSFNSQCVTGKVRISWKTEQELNTSHFIIRRSSDGRNWTEMVNLAASGNTSTAVNYSWTDVQPLSGSSYYQIQQFDIDGHMTVSPVLFNDCGALNTLKVFPNPAVATSWVSIQSSTQGMIMLRLYDMKGRLLQQRRETIMTGTNQVELPMSRFAAGAYSLVVVWPNGETKVVRVEKQ